MNKDIYKRAIDQIHPSEDLKKKTLENMLEYKKKRRIQYIRYIAVCAMMIIVCFIGQNYFEIEKEETIEQLAIDTNIQKVKNDLPRFKSMQQLKDVLKESNGFREINGLEEATDLIEKSEAPLLESESFNAIQDTAATKEFSTTNVQVENVDEADTVKTDGNYIYHVTDNKVFIIKADTLEIVSIINENVNSEEMNERFSIHEIFINKDYLIVLGNNFYYQQTKTRISPTINTQEKILEDVVVEDMVAVRSTQVAKAIVYDISDRTNPIKKREVDLEGYYTNARMIGDYVYFMSTKSAYYTSTMKDEEILPSYRDTAVSKEKSVIHYTDIAYFEGTNHYNFTLVAGFNIKNQEEISLETFLGASETVYASEKNLYLTQVSYNYGYYRAEKSTIYKFNLENRTNCFTM